MPRVAYTVGVMVRDNACFDFTGALILETYGLCALRCSIRVLGCSRDTPER